MVTREGRVKVMDFGIARMQTARDRTADVVRARHADLPLARAGAGAAGRRALGHLLARRACSTSCSPGRPPFTGDSPVAIAYKQVNETPIPPSQLNPDVPPRLDAVVMKALSKNPANRYQTAEEFSADLERVTAGQDVRGHAAAARRRRRDAGDRRARRPPQVMPPHGGAEGIGPQGVAGVLIGVLIVARAAGRRLPPGDRPHARTRRETFGIAETWGPDARGREGRPRGPEASSSPTANGQAYRRGRPRAPSSTRIAGPGRSVATGDEVPLTMRGRRSSGRGPRPPADLTLERGPAGAGEAVGLRERHPDHRGIEPDRSSAVSISQSKPGEEVAATHARRRGGLRARQTVTCSTTHRGACTSARPGPAATASGSYPVLRRHGAARSRSARTRTASRRRIPTAGTRSRWATTVTLYTGEPARRPRRPRRERLVRDRVVHPEERRRPRAALHEPRRPRLRARSTCPKP